MSHQKYTPLLNSTESSEPFNWLKTSAFNLFSEKITYKTILFQDQPVVETNFNFFNFYLELSYPRKYLQG